VTEARQRLIEVAETASTFDEARNLGATEEGTAIFTFNQKTAVGGLAPLSTGSLFFTIITYPRQSATTSPLLILTTALSIAEGIIKTTGFTPLIRWPNTLTLHGRKIASAAVEMDVVSDVIVRALVGGGIYCRKTPLQSGEEFTSIAAEIGGEVDERHLLENVLEAFNKNYELYKAGWRAELIGKIRDLLEYINTTVSVTFSHGTQLIGYIEDLDELGRMSFRVEGERIFLAPADIESISPF